jgi:hypothetical protein
MISSLQATWLAFLICLSIGGIGAAIGYFASLITRKKWGIRAAAADGATAFAVAFIYAFSAGEILAARGGWYDLTGSAIIVGAGSVIVKHIVQAAFAFQHRA